MRLRFIFPVVIILLLTSCKKENNNHLFILVDPEQSNIDFINQITESDSINVLDFMNIYTGGGVAVGDVNNDSLPDLFFSGNMVSSRLYINKSTKDNLVFEDITSTAGVITHQWISGVTMVDINQDGLLDIYACSTGSKHGKLRENKLFINQGFRDGLPRFKESAEEYGLNDSTYTTQASFFDYDQDGDLDAFLAVNYAENYHNNTVSLPIRKQFKFDSLRSGRLYKNTFSEQLTGNTSFTKKFIDVSAEAGINATGYSLGIAVSDVNTDGWPDVYLANDFLSNDIVYVNNGNGTFSNQTEAYFKHTSYAGMGADIADINNDGLTDIAVVDMIPEDNVRMKSMMNKSNYNRFMLELRSGYSPQFSRNTLQLNNGKNSEGKFTFSEIGQFAGIHHTDWSWSVLMADYDNDGWKDIFITNGFLRDMQDLDFIKYIEKPITLTDTEENKRHFLNLVHKLPAVKVPNYLYKNKGDLSFQNVTETWGLSQPSCSNGAAYADLDNDGDLDLVVSNINASPYLYNNMLSLRKKDASFLKINFTGPAANIHGVGTKVEIQTGKGCQLYENYPTKGFQSCVNSSIHAGLGKNAKVDTLTVTWPDGQQQVLTNLSANRSITINYKNSQKPIPKPPARNESLFTEVNKEHGLVYKHQEDDYIDFNYQKLLPFKLSQNGPGLAVGDIDQNGTDDFYVAGSSAYPGTFFKQNNNGLFQSHVLHKKAPHEDRGSLLFDADKDGDLDLYVVSGSVEKEQGDLYYQDRLYINNGRGQFVRNEQALPRFTISGSCVLAADYDKDGDLDLFIGGRSVPGQYPLPTSSKILQNQSEVKDKPVFIDVTEKILPSLSKLGMVTAALWTDYDNDSWIDLLIVGEGMPVSVFKNNKGIFTDNPTAVSNNARGYWNSIVSADFDADGDMDYVIGNMGRNSLLKASTKQPVQVYANDFDKNGTIDPILFYYVMGKNVPFHPRDEFVEQMNVMRGVFNTYAKYASMTKENLFSEEDIKQSFILTYENFETSYLQNNLEDGFQLKPMPVEAQLSQINGMLAEDFDGDGKQDIMMVGNSYAPNLSIGWYDAFTGKVFHGNGDGSFKAMSMQKTGLFINGDAKAATEITSAKGEPLVLISSRNENLKIYKYKHQFSSILTINPMDAGAVIHYTNGRTERKEFHYGFGYLSQSTRHLKLSGEIKSVWIYDYRGNKREINISGNLAKK